MEIDTASLLILLTLVGLAAWTARSTKSRLRALRQLRHEAQLQFEELLIQSPDPRYSFTGRTARIVRREETGGSAGPLESSSSYVLAIWATNELGERFHFRSAPGNAYIKHIAGAEAKLPSVAGSHGEGAA